MLLAAAIETSVATLRVGRRSMPTLKLSNAKGLPMLSTPPTPPTPQFDIPFPLYVPTKSTKGVSVPIATRVPLEMLHSIDEIVQSIGSPWKTRSDFLREATFWFQRKVSKNGKIGNITPQVVSAVLLWQRQNFEREIVRLMAEAVISTVDEMNVYIDFSELGELSQCLEDACASILKIENKFWFKRAAKAIFDSVHIRRAAENLKHQGLLGAASIRVYDMWKVVHASTGKP